jgi:hypothetical protein
MTEAEWLACEDPWAMLEFLRGGAVCLVDQQPPGRVADARRHLRRAAGDRPARMFACACCRRLWPVLRDTRSRDALEVAERFLEGLASDKQLWAAHEDAQGARDAIRTRPGDAGREAALVSRSAAVAVMLAVRFDVRAAAEECATAAAWASLSPGVAEATRDQVRLLHDVVGSPFRPPPPIPAPVLNWSDGTGSRLARAAYDERQLPSGHLDPGHLAVLADALEEAGCGDAVLMAHLRSPGPHVRGCWAVDLVLGRG